MPQNKINFRSYRAFCRHNSTSFTSAVTVLVFLYHIFYIIFQLQFYCYFVQRSLIKQKKIKTNVRVSRLKISKTIFLLNLTSLSSNESKTQEDINFILRSYEYKPLLFRELSDICLQKFS